MPDSERPLAARGERDAPEVGRWLRKSGQPPDRVVCSPARRTRQTWRLASAELAVAPPVGYDERLYLADADEFLRVVRECPEDIRTLLVIGHCPSVQEVTLSLAGQGEADTVERVRTKFPTAALAVLTMSGRWAELAPNTARLAAFVVPRG